MSALVRLRFIDRLERIRDQVSENLMKVLRRGKVHAQARCDLCNRLVVRVENDRSEGESNDANALPCLHEQVHEMDWSPVIPDFQKLVSVGQFPPTGNHHLIAHQQPSFGKIFDVPSLNAKATGSRVSPPPPHP